MTLHRRDPAHRSSQTGTARERTCPFPGIVGAAARKPTGLNPLQTEIDNRGQAWLADWLATLLERRDRPLTPAQAKRLQEVVRQNAGADHAGLRNWSDFASLLVSTDDDDDLFERMQEWTETGRYGWIFGANPQDSFSLGGEVSGFDLTGILDSESERERMAVLSYLFRRVERVIEDRRPTVRCRERQTRAPLP